jgi:hypothetical protein
LLANVRYWPKADMGGASLLRRNFTLKPHFADRESLL